MSGKFCHDTEIVDSESVPKLSDKKTLKNWIRNVANSPYTSRTLAVQVEALRLAVILVRTWSYRGKIWRNLLYAGF